jgi:hypothetical protein
MISDMQSQQAYFAELERREPIASAVVYGLCYLILPISGQSPRFSPQYIHFDLLIAGRTKSVLSIRYDGEAWGGSLLSGSLDKPFAPRLRELISDAGRLLGARTSFGDIGHHTFIAGRSGRPGAALLAGHLTEMSDIVARIAAITRSTNPA